MDYDNNVRKFDDYLWIIMNLIVYKYIWRQIEVQREVEIYLFEIFGYILRELWVINKIFIILYVYKENKTRNNMK